MKKFIEKYRLSIIIPHYNNAQELEDTICSILKYCKGEFEVVVIDGGSKDNWEQILKNYQKLINITFISEADRGEYDAMNKGITLAQGKYLLFLMAADTFVSDLNIQNINGPCMFPVIRKNNNKIIKIKLPYLGLPNCHQGIIFNNNKIQYDLRYKIASDYQYYLDHSKTVKFPYDKQLTLVAYDEGDSGVNFKERDEEILQIIRRNFSSIKYLVAYLIIKAKHIVKNYKK